MPCSSPLAPLPLQAKLDELEAEMLEVNGNSDRLARSYNELVELQLVLEKAGSFFDQARVEAAAENFERSYSTQEDMGAPLLEAALPVRGGVCGCGCVCVGGGVGGGFQDGRGQGARRKLSILRQGWERATH